MSRAIAEGESTMGRATRYVLRPTEAETQNVEPSTSTSRQRRIIAASGGLGGFCGLALGTEQPLDADTHGKDGLGRAAVLYHFGQSLAVDLRL